MRIYFTITAGMLNRASVRTQLNNSNFRDKFLKIKSELSGKKWDAASKGISKHGLLKIEVNGENKIAVYTGK